MGTFDSTIELGRIVRFVCIGLLTFFVYTAVTLSAIEYYGLSPVLGSLIGQLASVAVSYFGHFAYSFKAEPYHDIFIWRFGLTMIVLFGVNIGATWIFTEMMHLRPRISIGILTILIPLISYFLNRFWVFAPGLKLDPRLQK
jgi:putative flippase GtrA